MKINHKEKEEQLKIEKQLIEEFKEGEIICDDYNIKDSKNNNEKKLTWGGKDE